MEYILFNTIHNKKKSGAGKYFISVQMALGDLSMTLPKSKVKEKK